MECIRFFGIFFIKISGKIKIYKINSSFLSKFAKILEFLKRICKEVQFNFFWFQVFSKPEELWFSILLLKIMWFLNFKESYPQFFLIFFQNIQELVGKMNKVKKGIADKSFEPMILRTGVHCLIPYTTNSFT